MLSGMISSSDGTPLYYECFGNGPPLILCNGLMCQRAHWRNQIEYFSKKYQVVTFDYRGHGASGMPANDRHITIDWCARDALSILESLSLSTAVFFGHSMGVAVSLRAAILRPDRVGALVLICGAVSDPFESMFYSNRMKLWHRLSSQCFDLAPGAVTFLWKKMTARSRFGYFLASQLGFNPNLAEERDVWTYIDGVHMNRLETFYALLKDYGREQNQDWLAQIKSPTLLIAGEEDCITPTHLMESLNKAIPGSELEIIPSGSHNAHADLPRVVNSRIERFLSEVE